MNPNKWYMAALKGKPYLGGVVVTTPAVKMPDTSWGRKYLTLRGPWDRPYLTIKGKTVPDFVATRFRYGLVGVVQSAVFFNILH